MDTVNKAVQTASSATASVTGGGGSWWGGGHSTQRTWQIYALLGVGAVLVTGGALAVAYYWSRHTQTGRRPHRTGLVPRGRQVDSDLRSPVKHIRALIKDSSKTLTPEFVSALTTIFNEELDLDKDGALNDAELDGLLLRVQGTRLTDKMKAFIQSSFEIDKNGYLTLDGFIGSYEWVVHNLSRDESERALQRDLAAFGWSYDHYISD
eukprot:TRINITY_DN2704_c3_g1_i1.p1 TRINITY_DN2704_c3_g1~~TRINITY_DN2704_c3_g1_i1.p1  ORF type:complete len:219 (+),score=48.83 TRINITY_DN2704_c3_g1_i1:34-657(+)